MDTFPIVRKNDEKVHSESRPKRLILEVYDAMAEAARTGTPYQTRLDPPPAAPRIAHPGTEARSRHAAHATELPMTLCTSAATLARLEKVAADNGFDCEAGRDGVWLTFASSQTPMRLWLSAAHEAVYLAAFSMAHVAVAVEAFGHPLAGGLRWRFRRPRRDGFP